MAFIIENSNSLIILLFIILINFNLKILSTKQYYDNEKHGPEFLIIPPTKITFMNDTGTILTCSVRGRPTPKIYWIYSTTDIDNNGGGGGLINSHQQTIIPVDGLQQIRQDTLTTSQLIYLPFKANQYRQDLHSITIRCIATNQFGSIQSHNIQIRACK